MRRRHRWVFRVIVGYQVACLIRLIRAPPSKRGFFYVFVFRLPFPSLQGDLANPRSGSQCCRPSFGVERRCSPSKRYPSHVQKLCLGKTIEVGLHYRMNPPQGCRSQRQAICEVK